VPEKILIVEDERAIVDILTFNLKREGYDVLQAGDGESGLALIQKENPDLVLLDIMLPGLDGFSVCRRLRQEGAGVPIIILTAREDESDKVRGLELGADDYITKPFSMRELLARVRANMRRTAIGEGGGAPTATATATAPGGDDRLLRCGPLSLHLGRAEAYKNGSPLSLTSREIDLLAFFMRRQDQVISRESLMREVWNYDYFGDLRTVDVAVRRLREKIEDDPGEPRFLLTRRGIGYLLASPQNNILDTI